MRYQTGVEPSSKVTCSLNPILQSALANLDVQLEDELARYRRLRLGGPVSQRQPRRRSPGHTLDLISVSATGGRTNPAPEANAAPPTTNLSHELLSHELLVEPYRQQSDYQSPPTYPVVGNAIVSDLAIAVHATNHALPESELLPLAGSPPGNVDELVKPYSQRLDDYLESSEELLKSLAEEETAVQTERGFMRNLLTPLGAGSMMLLLISSAMFGYVLMNPNSLGRLLALRHSTSTSNAPTAVAGGESSTVAKPQPDLAAQEFKDLSLDTLGTLEVNPRQVRSSLSPNPTISPSGSTAQPGAGGPASSPSPTNLTGLQSNPGASASVPVVPPNPGVTASRPAPVTTVEPPYPAQSSTAHSTAPAAPRSAPAPQSSKPAAPAPTMTNTAPVASSSTGSTTYPYKIVTPYSGDRALEDARKLNPDAYVTNFTDGAYIQHGASSNEAEAKARAEALRSQGIDVEVKRK